MASHLDSGLIKFAIIVAIAIGSTIFNWMKKRAEIEQQRRQPPPPDAPPPKQTNWEEELRRVLAGEEPSAPAPPPIPPPVPVMRPVVVAPPARPIALASPRPRPLPPPRPVEINEEDVGLPVHMPTLAESAQAYLRASQLESKVAAHMGQIDDQVRQHKLAKITKPVSPEIRQALSLLRDRPSVRSALIASVILGPPRGLEA